MPPPYTRREAIPTIAGVQVDAMKPNVPLLVGQILGLFLAFALAIFLPAGTLAWPAGWAFLVLFFGFTIAVSAWLLVYNPGLLTERMTGGSGAGAKTWDRLLLLAAGIAFFGWLILMPLDAVRFRWSEVPIWAEAIGAILLLISFYLFFVTYRENSYLSPVVRVQQDRGQTVISTGPYAWVRHPMYAAFALLVAGTPLLLGSWYGLAISLVLVIIVARRAVLEERTLRAELPGYTEYAARVRYRLIPFVW